MNTPLLSVCLITYNHEKYIGQAIEGVLMQKVNFSWEFIIADDCSTDKTAEIIERYSREHPDFIKPILRQKNVGARKNFIELISAPRSKYIAYFEGDDYWTDPLKLQKQVDFLENNPDYEVSFTNINIVNDKDEIVKDKLIIDDRKSTYIHKDLPIWAPSLTRVFRNRDFSPIDCDVPGQDTLWLLYQSKFGKIKFINEVTGSYRLHDQSIYSSKSNAIKKTDIIKTHYEALKFIDNELLPKYFGMILKKLVELKAMDMKLFHEYKAQFFEYYKIYKPYFSVFQNIKIRLGFLIISIPFLKKNKYFSDILLRILNKLFIY